MTDDQLNSLSDEDLEARYNEELLTNAGADEPADDIPQGEPVEPVDDDSGIPKKDPVDEGDLIDNPGSDTDVVSNDGDPIEPENNEVDVVVDPESEPVEGQPDGEPKSGEEQPAATPTETIQQEFQPLKVSGKEIPINSMEELYTLASGGAAVTQKFQEIAGHKKSISIMEKHGLTETDLSLLIEARSGNKDALASLVKQSGIESLDVTDEVSEGYQPGIHIPSDQQMGLQEVQAEIQRDPEYGTTQNIVNNMMDESSQNRLVQNPAMIKALHQDVKSGAYEAVSAHAHKLKLMDGGARSDIEYYIQAANEGPSAQPVQPQNQAPVIPAQQPQAQQPQKRTVSKDKRKSAGGNNQRVEVPSIKEVNDMSDDDLMEYRAKIMANR